jgi:MoaA/NifB/PqqE/SkfB family radical SAM enzyme
MATPIVQPQNTTLTGALPHDRPTPDRPFRLYVALTNHCNRSCPWCSTCSSPKGSVFLSPAALRDAFPADVPFELQLEGGEPTVHPRFWEMVALARAAPNCTRVVVVTTGVARPRDDDALTGWLERLGAPGTIKLSVNHHLLEHDVGLLDLAVRLDRLIRSRGEGLELVMNVRLRRGTADDDAWVTERVRAAGLIERANVFHLQRYGYAAKRRDWDLPFIVGDHFELLNPDGSRHGVDLTARSEGMRGLR